MRVCVCARICVYTQRIALCSSVLQCVAVCVSVCIHTYAYMYVQIAPLPANTLTRKLTTPTHITHIHFEISKNQTDEFISSVTAEKEEIDKKARRMKEEDDMAHRVTGMSAKKPYTSAQEP